jgi:hypothetical protein
MCNCRQSFSVMHPKRSEIAKVCRACPTSHDLNGSRHADIPAPIQGRTELIGGAA